MDIEAIAGMYTNSSYVDLRTQASVSVLDKAMDAEMMNASQMLEMLSVGTAAMGSVGQNIDVYA